MSRITGLPIAMQLPLEICIVPWFVQRKEIDVPIIRLEGPYPTLLSHLLMWHCQSALGLSVLEIRSGSLLDCLSLLFFFLSVIHVNVFCVIFRYLSVWRNWSWSMRRRMESQFNQQNLTKSRNCDNESLSSKRS